MVLPFVRELLADLEQIRQGGKRATDLTQQLLTFGSRKLLTLAPLDLNQAVRESQLRGLAEILHRNDLQAFDDRRFRRVFHRHEQAGFAVGLRAQCDG